MGIAAYDRHKYTHPVQGVVLDLLAVDGFQLTAGANIDKPAAISVQLRPFAVAKSSEQDVYITSPDAPMVGLEIPSLYGWLAERAAAGDKTAGHAFGLLMQAIGEEYTRQYAKGPPV